jgi:hypothetical protein
MKDLQELRKDDIHVFLSHEKKRKLKALAAYQTRERGKRQTMNNLMNMLIDEALEKYADEVEAGEKLLPRVTSKNRD